MTRLALRLDAFIHRHSSRMTGCPSVVSRKTAFLPAIAASLLASAGASAQDVLDRTPAVPDLDAIRAEKILPPGTLVAPIEPISPDPMISTLPPGSEYKDRYWKRLRELRAEAAAQARSAGTLQSSGAGAAGAPIIISEEEVDQGQNDDQAHAEPVGPFGTAPMDSNRAIISGSLGEAPPLRLLAQVEDDGAIPLALETGVTGGPDRIGFSGFIGDGPLPGTVSDFDFMRVFLPAGTTFDISVRTPIPFGDLDPFVTFYLPDGTIIFTQDDGGDGFDTFVRLTVLVDLDFLMSIGGFGAFFPADPFDSTSPSITGQVGSEGEYEFEMRVFPPPGVGDIDFFTFEMHKGDVLGAAVRNTGAPDIRIFNEHELLEKGVAGFGSFADPSSPLPVNGNSVIDYVAEYDGEYAISLGTSFGDYELELGVFRPGFEREPGRIQLIWLDYNGGPVSKEPWFGFPLVTNHTPLRDFLPAWGLPNSDQDVRRITRMITREARDSLEEQLDHAEENSEFGVVVLGNDGTGRWEWIEDYIQAGSFELFGITFEISVVEVSGTINEAFISTIGIASTIDPGNYSANDTALVLLDVLSAPPTGISANFSFSLNDVVLAPGATKENLVATVLGNIISHEVGHYIGNFHTDGFNTFQGIMDEGPGGLFNLAGIGPSGIFGEADTMNVVFIDEMYSTREGFIGDENTTLISAFAFSFFPFGP